MAPLEAPRFKFLVWTRLCSIFVYGLGTEIRGFAYFPTKGMHEGVCVIFNQKWEVTPCMSSSALLSYSLIAKIKFSLPQKNFHPLAMLLFILMYPPPNLDLPAFSITLQLNKTLLSKTISKYMVKCWLLRLFAFQINWYLSGCQSETQALTMTVLF